MAKPKPILLTNDKYEVQGAHLHQVDKDLLAAAAGDPKNLVEIKSAEDLMQLAEMAKDKFEYFRRIIPPVMNRRCAEYAYDLRENKHYTWRALAAACWSQWPDATWTPPSNQLAGMVICETAARILKKPLE